jgi:exodeoxyribonuclease VII large subunit
VDKNILQKLKDWRAKTARRENVELFRVISNQAVEEIARVLPRDKKELLEIKGIKEKKYAKYGEEILVIVRGEGEEFVEKFKEEGRVFEVGEYLDLLNEKLLEAEARIKGEISSVDDRGNYLFFKIKDKNGESLINCFIWRNDYQVSGVELEAGMEIVVWGYPSIYPVSGQMSFQTKLVELVGEGLLKKAYEELKKKLETEGLFLPDRKKLLPKFAQKIGLVTSHQGAAIGDFVSNVGNYGYKIKFFDSRVEGKQAVFNLVKGVKWFNKKLNVDLLVIVRGGGSLESLQAFNTEVLVREIASSKIPVLAGIGHEQDVTLAALAADKMVSTPTAAALEIRKNWDEALYRIERDEKNILNIFEGMLANAQNEVRESESIFSQKLADIFERFRRARENLKNSLVKIKMTIDRDKNILASAGKKLSVNYSRLFSNFVSVLKSLAEKIALHNPERQLKLGYSLISFNNKIVRSVKEVKTGDEVDIKMSDGKLKSKIFKVEP